jgi:DNA gyrase/topoisomerase IV subunit A
MKTSEYILKTNREYSLYVCSQRAIPNIEDGLKPSQRMPLWLLRNKAGKIKVSALSGMLAAEKIYNHGEMSANNAISLLAAPFKNNNCLIEGVGMFGSRVVPDGIGAPRYVEVARAAISEKVLYRDLDLVPQTENYDASTMQPIHMLPIIPLVLLNGIEGIAVGWSTSILPRSLKAIVDASIAALEGKKIKTLVPHYGRYDVSVAPLAVNQWEIRGKVKIEDTSTIRVTELPPGLHVENFLKRLDEMEDRDQITGFTDNSSEAIDIVVRFKRGTLKAWDEESAIDFLKLKEKVTERITVVDFGGQSIRTYENAEEVVKAFVQWRLGWYSKRFDKMLADAVYEVNYWRVLKALFDDGFTKRLGTFADRSAVEADVEKVSKKVKLNLDAKQLDRVVNLPTYRWTKAFEADVDAKIIDIDGAISDYQAILSSPDLLKSVYAGELDELRKKI